MAALAEYSNVYDSALAVLEEKGYQLWFDADAQLYCAERDGWDFQAMSPTSLLGLVAMFEHAAPEEYAEYWWRRAASVDSRALPTAPPTPYEPIYRKGRTES